MSRGQAGLPAAVISIDCLLAQASNNIRLMGLPDLERFDTFLASLSLDEPSQASGYECVVAVPPIYAGDQHGATFQSLPVKLWYRATDNLSLDPFIHRLIAELLRRDHRADRSVALTVLALYCLTRDPRREHVHSLNSILASATTSDLMQFYVLPFPPPQGFRFSFGPFTLGSLDKPKLSYWSERSGSDYHTRYGDHLASRLTIERAPHSVTVLPLNSFLDGVKDRSIDRDLLYLLVDAYYNHLSRLYSEDFWHLWLESQHHLIAYGAPYMPGAPLRSLPGAQMISIFTKIGGSSLGWVAPNAVGFAVLELARVDERIPAAERELKELYRFTSFSRSEIHQTLRTFVHFVSRAKRHSLEGRSDEAFLHFAIALDLLLGSGESITDALSRRAAVLVHRRVGCPYSEQKAKLRALYSARSKYVHEGRSPGSERTNELEAVCDEVLRCMLRLQADPEKQSTGFVDLWLKRLDHIASALEAAMPVEDSLLLANGILAAKS